MSTCICAYCNQPFPQPKRPRLCCDRSCSAKLARQQDSDPWSEEEIDFLLERCETTPHPHIVRGFLSKARREGWPKRSQVAIETKLKRLRQKENLQRKCVLDNWTRWELARQLGINRDRVRSWCRTSGLKATKISSNQTAISRRDLKAWLWENPSRVADVERFLLLGVLDDQRLVDHILSFEPSNHGYPRPVVCLDNGKTYPSAMAADEANWLSRSSVARACRTGGRAAGLRWAYVESQASAS